MSMPLALAGGHAPVLRRGFIACFVATLLVVVSLLSLRIGAVPIGWADTINALLHPAAYPREAAIIWNIRLPRMILGALVGAALGMSGALMQGLFRNPLADPGLVGVSAGASLAAAATIVISDRIPWLMVAAGFVPILPLGAFCGGLSATALLYVIATRRGSTSIPVLMLAGVALAALAGALNGLLVYMSDDRQLRDITFWLLGSRGGATWSKVVSSLPFVLPAILLAPLLAGGLNALALGEAEAFYLGLPVQRIKRATILLVAVAVGASVAAAGTIGFVGIVVPHALRLVLGADHRWILPMSGTLGALLLICADCLARTVVAPGELPIGILTAALGAPWFLFLLLRRDGTVWS